MLAQGRRVNDYYDLVSSPSSNRHLKGFQMKLNKNLVKGAIASLAATALLGMGMVPAQAADPVTTTFKVHLNVPASVAADWNIWWWGVADAGGPVDNVIGASDQMVGGVNVNKDWTPNFVGTDAYGSYAEFTLQVR